ATETRPLMDGLQMGLQHAMCASLPFHRQFLVLDNCARDSLMDSSKAEGVSIQSGRTGACMFQVCGYLSGMSSASAKASRPGEAAGGLRVERGATSLDKNG
ncbi:hypothetical protein JI435_089460, partial [Parastagonospora nodorum SN15]